METIYLEKWLHDIIRTQFKADPEYRQFAENASLNSITRTDINRYHLFQLKKTLAYAYEKSHFYHELFDKNGLKVEDIHSLVDLAKIPFTDPGDIAQHPYHLACVPLGDIARVTTFTSSGTTGPQKRVFFTEGDLEKMIDFMAAGIRAVASEGEVVQIMLPAGRPNDQADLLSKGVRKVGGRPVVTGTTPGSEEQVRIMEESHSKVLFAGVSRLNRITQETRYNQDLKALGVKTLFVTSEYLSESMRSQLKNIWNCDVHVHYGMTEMGLGVAVECHAHDGFHFNEAGLLVEVIDPVTGAVLEDDAEGELVFTALGREAMPLIRYRTHDISRLVGQPCECGAATLKKIARITRRTESVVKLGGGDEVYPSLFDEIIYGVDGIVDYQLTLGREGGKDTLHFKIEVAREDKNTSPAINAAIISHPVIRKNLAAATIASPRIELAGQGGLVRLSRAKKLIIDKRKKVLK